MHGLLLVTQTPEESPMPQLQLQSHSVSEHGVSLHFVPTTPGQTPSDYYLLLTEDDLVPVYTADQMAALIQQRLFTRVRAQQAAVTLDGLVGDTWSV